MSAPYQKYASRGNTQEDENEVDLEAGPYERRSLLNQALIVDEKRIEEDRLRRLQNIHAQSMQVNAVYQDLAGMVSRQGESLQTLETSTQNTAQVTKRAVDELRITKASHDAARQRWCWFALIVIIILALYVGVNRISTSLTLDDKAPISPTPFTLKNHSE